MRVDRSLNFFWVKVKPLGSCPDLPLTLWIEQAYLFGRIEYINTSEGLSYDGDFDLYNKKILFHASFTSNSSVECCTSCEQFNGFVLPLVSHQQEKVSNLSSSLKVTTNIPMFKMIGIVMRGGVLSDSVHPRSLQSNVLTFIL